jgi:zinc protease
MLKHRHIKPSPAKEYQFLIPEIQNFKLNNGLNVSLVERHNLPIVRVNLMISSGSKFDPAGKKGLANLTAMCIDEGAGEYDALQLSNEFDVLGTDFDIHCTNDNTYFLARLLKENLERTLDLFSTVIIKPHFDEKAFEREKRKMLTRILQTRDDSDEIASNAFEYLVFNRRHQYAYPVSGTEESINQVGLEDIKNYYRTFLVPSESHLIIVGDITREYSETLINKYFSEWSNQEATSKVTDNPPINIPGTYFIDKPGSVQSEIRMGYITEKRDMVNYFPRLLLNLILGGQFSSRINLNLRESKGYTYGAFSNFNFFKDAAYFFISTSVGKENTYNALEEIRKELKDIRNGVTEEELIFSKTSMIRKFPSNFETNGQIASSISRMILYNLPDDHFNNYLQLIHEISIEDVNKAAIDYIKDDNITTLIVGNKEDIIVQFAGKENLIELDINGEIKI